MHLQIKSVQAPKRENLHLLPDIHKRKNRNRTIKQDERHPRYTRKEPSNVYMDPSKVAGRN